MQPNYSYYKRDLHVVLVLPALSFSIIKLKEEFLDKTCISSEYLVPKLYNNRNKILKFDGRYVHDVTQLLSGTRYSVIFYKLWDRRLRNPQPLLVAPVFL